MAKGEGFWGFVADCIVAAIVLECAVKKKAKKIKKEISKGI